MIVAGDGIAGGVNLESSDHVVSTIDCRCPCHLQFRAVGAVNFGNHIDIDLGDKIVTGSAVGAIGKVTSCGPIAVVA